MKRIIRETPHRLPRECYQGRVVVAFTACTLNRCAPFLEKPIVDRFIEALRMSVETSRCLVPIYCFMPVHLHVILHGQEDRSE